MTRSSSTTVLKVFAIATVAMIFGLTAFGMGLGIGHAQGQASAQAAMLNQAAMTQVEGAAPLEQFGAPEQEAAPTPTPARRAVIPSIGRDNSSQVATDTPLDLELFNEAWSLLKDQYYGDLPEGQDLTYAAIRGVVQSLGDKHTGFLDPEQAAVLNSEMEGSFEGIGARVDIAEGGGVLIEYLFEGQPAEKAGLRVKDVVTAVDGKDVTGMDLNSAVSLIRGPRGTPVVLTVHREGQEPFDLKINRARIEMKLVESKTVGDGKIEYISLTDFASTAPKLVAQALEAAQAKKPQGIILDLRGNPGGLLSSAVDITSYFVPEGNILIERFKDGREEVYPREGRYLLGDTPLVVLVDAGSASASEILAGAVQDAGTGTLIGETTYGKGSVQVPNMLSDKSQLRVTIARWFTPKDREIHGKGLDPDIAVPITEEDVEAERDPQLDRAVEFLLTGK